MRFCQGKHYHEKFQDWVGQWVFVELDDCFGINVNVWPDVPWENWRTVLHCSNEAAWFKESPQAENEILPTCQAQKASSNQDEENASESIAPVEAVPIHDG